MFPCGSLLPANRQKAKSGIHLGHRVGEPQGFIYSIQNDSVPNVVKATGSNSNDGVSGNTEANSIGSDDLENLIAAVDPRTGQREIHDGSLHHRRVKENKDKYGRPIWNAGLSSATPDMIFGARSQRGW